MPCAIGHYASAQYCPCLSFSEVISEALQIAKMQVDLMPDNELINYLSYPRHEIVISENVAADFHIQSLLMIQQDSKMGSLTRYLLLFRRRRSWSSRPDYSRTSGVGVVRLRGFPWTNYTSRGRAWSFTCHFYHHVLGVNSTHSTFVASIKNSSAAIGISTP